MELRDWLDIVLEYLKVLAWPLAVAVLAFAFRNPITEALSRLEEASGLGAKARFFQRTASKLAEESELIAEELAENPEVADAPERPIPTEKPTVETRSPQASETSDDKDAIQAAISNELWLKQMNDLLSRGATTAGLTRRQLARARITTAWIDLNRVVRRLNRRVGLYEFATLSQLTRRLVGNGYMNKESADVAYRLAKLFENSQANDDQFVTPQIAADFETTAKNVKDALLQVEKKMDNLRKNPPRLI